MRGWQIFRHSVQLVFRNLDAALRVSALPFSATVAAYLHVQMTPGLMPALDDAAGMPVEHADPGAIMLLFVLQCASVLGGLWIAVAWHRYVLTEELAPGWIQPFRARLVLAYLGRTVMLGLLMLLAVVTLAIPGMLLLGIVPQITLIVLFGLLATAVYIFLRLGVILPAGAVDRRLTLHEAWQKTAPESGPIAVIAGLSVFVTLLLQAPRMLMTGGAGILAIAYGLAASWAVTMVGASLLTSLYGICVERRGID